MPWLQMSQQAWDILREMAVSSSRLAKEMQVLEERMRAIMPDQEREAMEFVPDSDKGPEAPATMQQVDEIEYWKKTAEQNAKDFNKASGDLEQQSATALSLAEEVKRLQTECAVLDGQRLELKNECGELRRAYARAAENTPEGLRLLHEANDALVNENATQRKSLAANSSEIERLNRHTVSGNDKQLLASLHEWLSEEHEELEHDHDHV